MILPSLSLLSMRFDWNIFLTILWQMPPALRFSIHYAWLKVLLSPLKTDYADFLIYRKNQIYESYLTGQTIQLQRLLNDRFDNELRRIRIIHSTDSDMILFLDEEDQADEDLVLYLDEEEEESEDLNLYLDDEIGSVLSVDFRILAPASLSDFQVLLENLVRKYALIDKTFDIQFV